MNYSFAYFFILISIMITLVRLVKGPDGVDRITSIDLISTFLACLIIVYIIDSGETVFLDLPLVLTLISFFATLMYGRYLEKRIIK